MQNVRPAGFARPHDGHVGPEGASDDAPAVRATAGAAGDVAAGDDAGAAPTAGAGPGMAGSMGAATAPEGGAGTSVDATGVDAPSGASAGWVPTVPASSAANSRNAPQLPQNASPAAFFVPHFAQIIPLVLASIGRSSRAA
jgi:hypothetical protein